MGGFLDHWRFHAGRQSHPALLFPFTGELGHVEDEAIKGAEGRRGEWCRLSVIFAGGQALARHHVLKVEPGDGGGHPIDDESRARFATFGQRV